MQLTAEQIKTVKAWLTNGATLSDVQNNLRSEFNLHPTFLDVRMLVMEIGAPLIDKVAQVDADDVTKAKLTPKKSDVPTAPAPASPASGVTITVDTLQLNGNLVSGNVIFTDGVKARWFFDSMGRFGFEPELPGYKPTPEDSKLFQTQLQQELSTRGY
ncbi:MAG: hypothetical protein RSD41_05185 [Kiritimatiellia bacterium]